MKLIGIDSYSEVSSEENSLGKEFTQEEIRDIIFHNLRNHVYKKEEEIDNILYNIKNVCFLYLADNNYIDNLNIQDVANTLCFLDEQLEYLESTQESLDVISYSWPFTEVAQGIDEFILHGTKDAYVHELINGKLAKDISNAQDLLKFSLGIMNQIKRDLLK